MKLLRPIIIAICAALFFSTNAFADACSSKARAMVSGDASATLLSVKSKKTGNGKVVCEARIKVSSGSTPPRIVIKKFNP